MKRLLLTLVLLTTSLCAVSLDDLRFLLDKEQFAILARHDASIEKMLMGDKRELLFVLEYAQRTSNDALALRCHRELALREHSLPDAARCLELAILTTARTSEALLAEWPEFDLEAGTWVVPAGRMKAKEAHTVYLSQRALDILAGMKSQGQRFDGREWQAERASKVVASSGGEHGKGNAFATGSQNCIRDYIDDAVTTRSGQALDTFGNERGS